MDAVGVDTGGTFTDFCEIGPGGVRVWKVPSTPAAPQEAILLGIGGRRFDRVVHGSTVATNSLLERRGARTVLITTEGFKDLLEIRRQIRPALYDLEPHRQPHVVARGDVITVRERLDAEARPVTPLSVEEVDRVVRAAGASNGDAFAICLLHSFANPTHERLLVDALRAAGLDACASFEIHPEYREYERASTTAVNAFLRPVVRKYLGELGERLPGIRVMHSAAGLTSADEAADRPVTMLLSGPAGGVLGARAVAERAGFDRIITFDMGGTSTDVALIDGAVSLRSGVEVDGVAVGIPMVDLVSVGAGGGSIARYDSGGALVVGPESAGADPGPACYGRGTLPTVSDADLALGRLRPEQLLAATMQLDVERSLDALATLGEPVPAAAAVIEVVNANMARGVRRVSLERGYDPADFTMVAFGGAGPLHACEVAEAIGVRRVLVPRFPGVLSALGMVTASEALERSAGLLTRLTPDGGALAAAGPLELEARAAFAEATGEEPERLSWYADVRYLGQAHELRVAFPEPVAGEIASAFHTAHQRQFGFAAPQRDVEVVTLRCRLEGRGLALPATDASMVVQAAPVTITVDGSEGRLWRRTALAAGTAIAGPAVVIQDDATTFVPAAWAGRVDHDLNLILEAR